MPSPASNSSVVTALTSAFLAGKIPIEPANANEAVGTVEAIVHRSARTLGRRWRWLRPLAVRYLAAFAGRPRPRHRDVMQFLRDDAGFAEASKKYAGQLRVVDWLHDPEPMQPAPAAASWRVPAILSVGVLAEWLRLTTAELDWFTSHKRPAPAAAQHTLHHYHYRILAKQSGSLRLIEAPKQHLKLLQRQILIEILEHIPIHSSAHGFTRGRSIQTFAGPHVGQRVVLRMDMQDFFPSIHRARIAAFFRTAGYPEAVADRLSRLCTHAAPKSIWKAAPHEISTTLLAQTASLYSRPHLPQGAPTSPALANICAYHLDCRLSGLAQAAGAQYTRYADDLAFSGGEAFERTVSRFAIQVAAIVLEEGFAIHHRKTRIMRQGVRQHLAGLITNQRLNPPREDFDRLRAILTNCVRHGAASQNRQNHPAFQAHLEGRVGFVEQIHRAKGARLRRILDAIHW